jgi:hypothetical protein
MCYITNLSLLSQQPWGAAGRKEKPQDDPMFHGDIFVTGLELRGFKKASEWGDKPWSARISVDTKEPPFTAVLFR